jgi:hypothetical protein
MKKSKVNQGRNIINIEDIKTYLSNYTKEKSLSAPIDSWLQKSFLRWAINYFTPVQAVHTTKHYEVLMECEVPSWFNPNQNIDFYFIDITHPDFLDTLNTCVEFLGSREERIIPKFPRMTVQHILKKHEEEHLRIQETKKKFIETSGEGIEEVFRFENLHIVKLLHQHPELSLEMARESALMQHCLGRFTNVEKAEGGYGSYYYNLIKNKEITLYSLRDEKNMPHATISLIKKHGKLWLDQIKGKQNLAPVTRYIPASIAFFNHIGVEHDYHQDCLTMDVVYIQGKSQQLSKITDEATQQRLIAYDPSFIDKLPNPSKSSLWLASLRNTKQMNQLENTSDAMKIASLLKHPLLLNELDFSQGFNAKKILQQTQSFNLDNIEFIFPKLEVTRI